jgi:hypothetical protein
LRYGRAEDRRLRVKPAATLALIALATLAGSPVAARDKDKGEAKAAPAALGKLLDCRAVTDPAARLACFDAAVASLDKAVTGGEVAVVDREEIRKAKRGLFGFSLGDLPLFGDRRGDGDKAEVEEVKEITAVLRAVATGPDGYVFTLEDGARWAQTDATTLGRQPRPGDQVTIRRMALGSYKLSFKIGPSIKVRRIG